MNTFKNIPTGLRVLQLPAPAASQVAYCGIAVHAGTRHETPQQHGMAHFVEHLTFKGTARRTAVQIINAIEGVGGELNAFTNKEDTVYYCAVQRRHLARAIDVLCDIVFASQYPQQELEKECEVVCDEIESYEDSPAELIYDEFENLLFGGHPLGHNILGTAQALRSYTSDHAQAFARQWYKPQNCVLFVSDSSFSLPPSPSPVPPSTFCSAEGRLQGENFQPATSPIIRHRGTHQAHVMMGTVAYAATDPRRWALYLLNNILGGPAMNSRLSLSLRERHGLVYTVDSSMASYSDTGLWSVYFGCDPHDVKRCCRLVHTQLHRLASSPLSERQLRAAKEQLRGQLAIAAENREQTTIEMARTFLHTGHTRTVADVMAHIQSLTATQLQDCAQQLFDPSRLTTLIYI